LHQLVWEEKMEEKKRWIEREVERYLKLSYEVRTMRDEEGEGYVAWIPDLRGCITCAETEEELPELIEDAKRAWLWAAIESGYKIPLPGSHKSED